jgi:hypothetical protein
MTPAELRAAHTRLRERRNELLHKLYSEAALRRVVLMKGSVSEMMEVADYTAKVAKVIDLLDMESRAIEDELNGRKIKVA